MTLDEEPLKPHDVPKGERVYCPECTAPMYVRDPDGCDRHFMHVETADHWRAVREVTSEMEDLLGVDFQVDNIVLGNRPQIGDRFPDAVANFARERDGLGRGLAVECAIHNHRSDVKTEEYLKAGYSVLWITRNDEETVIEEVVTPQ